MSVFLALQDNSSEFEGMKISRCRMHQPARSRTEQQQIDDISHIKSRQNVRVSTLIMSNGSQLEWSTVGARLRLIRKYMPCQSITEVIKWPRGCYHLTLQKPSAGYGMWRCTWCLISFSPGSTTLAH